MNRSGGKERSRRNHEHKGHTTARSGSSERWPTHREIRSLAAALPGCQTYHCCGSRARRPGWTSARGDEHSAGARLHQDCRHAGRHRVLHAAAALLAFAVFGSSRYLVVAADSATAAILAGGLAGMAPIASARYVALAGMVALLTAGFLLLARLLKLGFLADFLSQTVLVGFLTGVGFQVGIAVLGRNARARSPFPQDGWKAR